MAAVNKENTDRYKYNALLGKYDPLQPFNQHCITHSMSRKPCVKRYNVALAKQLINAPPCMLVYAVANSNPLTYQTSIGAQLILDKSTTRQRMMLARNTECNEGSVDAEAVEKELCLTSLTLGRGQERAMPNIHHADAPLTHARSLQVVLSSPWL